MALRLREYFVVHTSWLCAGKPEFDAPRAAWLLGLLGVLVGCSAASSDGPRANGTGGFSGGGGLPAMGGAPSSAGAGAVSTSGGVGSFAQPDTGGVGNRGDGGVPQRTKVTLDDCGATNPAQLSAADVQRLVAGGAPGDLRVTYPYEGTVFPRGLLSPLLIWQNANAQAIYVHIQSKLFEYRGCLVPSAPGEVVIPQNVWDAAGVQTEGANDPFTIEMSALENGAVKGPASHQIVIAQATLKGSIYYDSYNSTASGSVGGGAVLRLVPGKQAELFLRVGACTGCHAVSQNGSRLVAREIGGLVDGQIYDLTPTTGPNPTPALTGNATAFVGLSPDGSVYVSNAFQNGVGPRTSGAIPIVGNVNASLFVTDTSTPVADSGVPTGAMMPTFSTDGRSLVFTDFAINGGHGIATMQYDPATRKATGYKKLLETGQLYPGWPFFLPDNGGVVFSSTVSADFSGGGAGIIPVAGPASDLAVVDAASGQSVLLARAMGFATPADATSNTTYLPFGTQELHQSYYPTVSPVAAGGYFWVFFDSIRSYGSLGITRQLWGAAVTVSPDGKYTADPSHPAFYLTGQEAHTANHRAFTALDPCKTDGAACEAGVDCCSGFCTNGVCGVPQVPRCADTREACKVKADCCNPRESCIGGFCSTVLN
jgi:hypothetical protein